MASLRLLSRRLCKQLQQASRLDSSVSSSCQTGLPVQGRGLATSEPATEGSDDKQQGNAGSPGRPKKRRDWRALADQQLKQPGPEEAQRDPTASAAEPVHDPAHPWHAADHERSVPDDDSSAAAHDDPFMQMEIHRRRKAASRAAPLAEGWDPALHADAPADPQKDSIREDSYREDPFMRNERGSRGTGDRAPGPSDRAPEERPRSSRLPGRSVGGTPREVEYDDPFMRIERASRLPRKPDPPEAQEDAVVEDQQKQPPQQGKGLSRGQRPAMGRSAPAADPTVATEQADQTEQFLHEAQQGVAEEAHVAEAHAAELRHEVHRYESGQPSAASGKQPEHANIPRLRRQAARATQKAKQQRQGAKAEAADIDSHKPDVAAPPEGFGSTAATDEAPAASAQGGQVEDDAAVAPAAAMQAALDEEARLDKEAIQRTAASAAANQAPQQPAQGQADRPRSSQEILQQALAEMTGSESGPDPVSGFSQLGVPEGQKIVRDIYPRDEQGRAIPVQNLSREQRLGLLQTAPRISPDRLFLPGTSYGAQELVGEGSSSDMFGQQSRQRPVPAVTAMTQLSVQEVRAADFRNTAVLDSFLSESGRIQPRRRTRLSAKDQRGLVRKLKLARQLGLLPTTSNLASVESNRPTADAA